MTVEKYFGKTNSELYDKWDNYHDEIIIGRQKGSKTPITPTPEFKKAKVICALEPLAIVATTVATIAPEPIPEIILAKITKFREGAKIVKMFPIITKIAAVIKIFFLSSLFTILDKIIEATEILKVSKVAIVPI